MATTESNMTNVPCFDLYLWQIVIPLYIFLFSRKVWSTTCISVAFMVPHGENTPLFYIEKKKHYDKSTESLQLLHNAKVTLHRSIMCVFKEHYGEPSFRRHNNTDVTMSLSLVVFQSLLHLFHWALFDKGKKETVVESGIKDMQRVHTSDHLLSCTWFDHMTKEIAFSDMMI